MKCSDVSDEEVEKVYLLLKKTAEKIGYILNPNEDVAKQLVRGLLQNRERYGYMACPCRLASGNQSEDRDIICPCDYREEDIKDYGSCYCALYVSPEMSKRVDSIVCIPDRRNKK